MRRQIRGSVGFGFAGEMARLGRGFVCPSVYLFICLFVCCAC